MKKKLLWGTAAVMAAGLIMLIWVMDFPSWQQLDMEKLTNLRQTTVVYDADGQPIADLHSGENRVIVSIDEVPDHVKNAFIAIEDARFYEHCGIDIWRIGGAIVSNLKAGGYAEGASTITQQLIKLTHLTSEKRLSRKAQEAWLALQLEKKAGKDEILGMYLNTVYFGRGAYGIEAAAQAYFGRGCSELSLSEGALLAGIIKAPGKYAPHIDMEKAIERRSVVLDAMAREKMISPDEAASAGAEAVELVDSADSSIVSGGWYIDWVIAEAEDIIGSSAEDILSGGYRIYTALENDMQTSAEVLFEDGAYFPGNAGDGTKPEAALIAINPDNGEIMCMVGGRSYDTQRGLNRAMQISRQPGSAFKPISVYAAAIDFMGYTPISLIEDTARDFGGGYTPSNASGNEYGTVTLREALMKSMNLATVDLITRTGIQAAKMYAERAGIPLSSNDDNLSLALGSLTEGVSPAQMSAAYAPLVNGGHRVNAHTIRRIENLYREVLYEYEAANEYVMSEQSARMLTSILEDAAAYGTAKQLAAAGFPVASKTGTVGHSGGGNRDAWTVAYTPSVSVAVWMGYDMPDEAHVLPEGATGGTYPARLAAAFLKKTESVSNGGAFDTPDGMTHVLIDGKALKVKKAAMLASESTPAEYLIDELLPNDNLPVLTSDLWDMPERVEAVYVQADSSGFPAISFVAPNSNVEYRIIRKSAGNEEEVGSVEGRTGEYITFIDQSFTGTAEAEYAVIARHSGFMEIGMIVDSDTSEWVAYSPPGILERLLLKKDSGEYLEGNPLFGTKVPDSRQTIVPSTEEKN